MNDGGYRPLDADRARRYRETQKAIVRGLKKAEVRLIVLGSPGCVDSDTFRTDPDTAAMYNKALSQLRDIDRELAAEEDVAFADVHGAMMDVMGKLKAKYGRSYHLAGGDGIHPAPKRPSGHGVCLPQGHGVRWNHRDHHDGPERRHGPGHRGAQGAVGRQGERGA